MLGEKSMFDRKFRTSQKYHVLLKLNNRIQYIFLSFGTDHVDNAN